MPKRIIVVTGAYGKTGKTIFSVCAGLSYMDMGNEPVYIDCNDQNADLDKVFDFYHTKADMELENYRAITKAQSEDSHHKRFQLVIPHEPTHSIHQIFALVESVMLHFKEHGIFIIDTNKHLDSFYLLKNEKISPNTTDLVRYKRMGYEIIVFHFWDFGSISHERTLLRTRQTVEMLEKLNVKVIHIFSAHMLQILSLLGLKSNKQGKQSLANVQKLFNEYWKKGTPNPKIMPYTVLHSVLKIAHEKAFRLKGQKIEKIGAEFPVIWEQTFQNLLEFTKRLYTGEKNVKPANLVLIPYINGVLQIVEQLTITGKRNNSQLKDNLGTYYVVVRKAISNIETILSLQGS